MKKHILLMAWLALITLGSISCSKDDEVGDTTAPSAVISMPVDGQAYTRANTLLLSAQFSDDQGLKECTFYLEQAGLKSTKGWDDPWNPEEQTIELNGLKDELKDVILFESIIPADVMSSDYVLNVLVVDQALNYTRYKIPISIK